MKIEVDLNLFAIMLEIKPIFLFVFGEFLVIIDPFPISDGRCNLMKILLIELLDFGSEYFGEYLIDLIIMSEFDHPIGLINNKILEEIKIKDSILQKLMYSARRPNNNMRLSLPDDSQLPMFRHATNNRKD
jgi:hypothetical protein